MDNEQRKLYNQEYYQKNIDKILTKLNQKSILNFATDKYHSQICKNITCFQFVKQPRIRTNTFQSDIIFNNLITR